VIVTLPGSGNRFHDSILIGKIDQMMMQNARMPDIVPEVHTFTTQLDCQYLLHVPDPAEAVDVLVLALHGYGMTPESMLRLTVGLVGERFPVAALQAPFQHYQALRGASSTAAYNWGIRDHWASGVRLHHDMVQKSLVSLGARFGLSAERCLLAGFSQPVGLNYRFVGTHPASVGGVLGLCGGVPRDWEDSKYLEVRAPILHISRDQDEFYPNELVKDFPRRLAAHASDVEFHLIPGQHRFPSKGAAIVRPWLARKFALSD
jgi:predicted esterase